MSIEQKINYQLNKYPSIKKYIKRGYQFTMYALSQKIKSEGNIVRVSPNDGAEYFFSATMTSHHGTLQKGICCA